MVRHSGELVKAAMKDKGMTQVELASRIGKDQTLISRYVSGKIEISVEVARSIAEALELDFEELRQQLKRDKLERRREHLRAEFKEIISDEADLLSSSGLVYVGHVGHVEESSGAITVPLMDSVPSGAQDWSQEKAGSYVFSADVQVDPEKSFALKISGEKMTDDVVDEGDIVLVDQHKKPKDGDRVVVILNGEPMLRKMYHTGETVMLQSPENRGKPVIFVSPKDDFEVVGRVTLCIKLFVSS
jgi:SOS-response transcriptional repressor LexA